jgi:hypothetical protein
MSFTPIPVDKLELCLDFSTITTFGQYVLNEDQKEMLVGISKHKPCTIHEAAHVMLLGPPRSDGLRGGNTLAGREYAEQLLQELENFGLVRKEAKTWLLEDDGVGIVLGIGYPMQTIVNF